jgi:ATP-binding cassette subfamily B protein
MIHRIFRLGLAFDWFQIVVVLICKGLAAALPVGIPLILGHCIDAAVKGASLLELLPQLGVVVALAVSAALVEVTANSQGARIGYGLSWQLAKKVYGQLLRMPLLTYATINPGVLNSRLTNDMRMIDPLFTSVPLAVTHGWVGLAAVAVALCLINFWFLAAFALVPVALLGVRFAEGRINRTISDSYEVNALVASQIESTTSGDAVSLIRQASATKAEELRFAGVADRSAELAARMDNWRAMVGVVYRLCFDLITVLFLGIGVLLASSGQASVGSVVSALFFVGMVRQPLGEVVGQRYPLIRANMGLDRVEAVDRSINTGLPSVAASPRPAPNAFSADVLTFESVGYAYPRRSDLSVDTLSEISNASSGTAGFLSGITLTRLEAGSPGDSDPASAAVLRDISFVVKRGETVAIAGESGAGKSTILSLACGSVRPSSGAIYLCGNNSKDLTEEDLWSFVSLVSQDIYLRDASLRENLAYGHHGVSDDQLRDALNRAGLDDLFKRLPDGLDTMVGQRGKRFSGGERQRIAIARAVLRDRPLLVLDEATSHLDAKREEGILDSIESIAGDKAVLVVAHRKSAIERANHVIVIDSGQIKERGTHGELMTAGGEYARLHLLDR